MDCYVFVGSPKLCHVYGCFDSSDTQLSVTLDGEEVYYADFKKGELIWDSRVPVEFHVSWAYRYAVLYSSQCNNELKYWKHDKSATLMSRG